MLRIAGIAATLLLVLVAAAAFATFKGSPGSCGPAADDTQAAALVVAYERKWIAFNQQLAFGQPATLAVNDAEATARAQFFLDETGAPIDDVSICFAGDGADASNVISTPFGPDVRVRIEGNADLSRPHPRARIDEVRIGALPGFVTRPFHGLIEGIVDDQAERITLSYPLDVDLRDGEAVVTSAEE